MIPALRKKDKAELHDPKLKHIRSAKKFVPALLPFFINLLYIIAGMSVSIILTIKTQLKKLYSISVV